MTARGQTALTTSSVTGLVVGSIDRLGGLPAALIAVGIALAAQLSIGTAGGQESFWRLDRPFDQDMWYYAGLARALFQQFPARNPAFADALLSQHVYHLAPLSALSAVVSPYLAMRLLNVVYVGLFAAVARRYLGRAWGFATLALLVIAPPWYRVNPVSLDLLTRGFHHWPFFIVLLPAMYERRRWGRAAALFALPWLHLLMALVLVPALIVAPGRPWGRWEEGEADESGGADGPRHEGSDGGAKAGRGCLGGGGGARWRVSFGLLWPLAALLFGLVASLGLSWSISRGLGGGLDRRFGFDPVEPVLHLIPLAPALIWAGRRELMVAAAAAFILTMFLAWNRFYAIFPLDVALALSASCVIHREDGPVGVRRAARTFLLLLLSAAFMAVGVHRQFRDQTPFNRAPVADALAWVEDNTSADAVFLQAPTPSQVLADPTPFRERGFGYWLMEKRDLYCAYFGWSQAVGLSGDRRSAEIDAWFRGLRALDGRIDFVFVGPMERAMYGDVGRGLARPVYRDAYVSIHPLGEDPAPPRRRRTNGKE